MLPIVPGGYFLRRAGSPKGTETPYSFSPIFYYLFWSI